MLLTLCSVAGASDATAGRTFYLDAVAGDDSRDGLTTESAWRSLAKLNKSAIQPGDTVLFRRGGVWRGQLIPANGSAGPPVVYSAFGEGPKPLLLGSVSMNRQEDWQQAGTDLWATPPVKYEPGPVIADLGRASWRAHQEGGAACKLTPVTSDQGLAVCRVECSSPGLKSNFIQIIAPGISISEGEYYLVNFRVRCSKPISGCSIALMKDTPPWTHYAEPVVVPIGEEWAEHTIRFHANIADASARLDFFLGGTMQPGAVLEIQPGKVVKATCSQPIPLFADIGNIIFDDGRQTGVKKWDLASLRQDGDYYYDPQSWQVVLRSKENPTSAHKSIELALCRHIINQSGRSHVTYDGLALSCGAAHGIGGNDVRNITVRNCDVSYIGGGLLFRQPDGAPVRYGNGIEFWSGARDCLVEKCRLWEIYDAALTNQGSGENVQENITYRYNVIWNAEYSFEFWNRGPASLTRNIRFEHNTCVNAGYGWAHGQRPDPNGRHLMFYDNTSVTEDVFIRCNVFCDATDSCVRLNGRDWSSALRMEYNCWYQSKGALFQWLEQTYSPAEFPSFQRRFGKDAHSIVADPLFVDAAHNDYRLAPESLARTLCPDDGPAGALP